MGKLVIDKLFASDTGKEEDENAIHYPIKIRLKISFNGEELYFTREGKLSGKSEPYIIFEHPSLDENAEISILSLQTEGTYVFYKIRIVKVLGA